MNPEQRNSLQQKKQKVQLRLAIQEYVDRAILPLLAILDELGGSGECISFRQLLGVKPEWKDGIRTVLREAPFSRYGLADLPQSPDIAPITQLLEMYPSVHPTRYLPDLPLVGMAEENLSSLWDSVLDSLQIADQRAYLYYFRYALLLEVDLQGFANWAKTDLFDLWNGDALLFPADGSWLIAYSDRDEWYAGRK